VRHGLAAGLSDGGADPPMLLSFDGCVASCSAMTCTPPRQLTGDPPEYGICLFLDDIAGYRVWWTVKQIESQLMQRNYKGFLK
jgi:hypothetical protein